MKEATNGGSKTNKLKYILTTIAILIVITFSVMTYARIIRPPIPTTTYEFDEVNITKYE